MPEIAKVKTPPGPALAPALRTFLRERFNPQRIFANDQLGELIDCMFERGAQRAAEECRADAFDAVFGLHSDRDE